MLGTRQEGFATHVLDLLFHPEEKDASLPSDGSDPVIQQVTTSSLFGKIVCAVSEILLGFSLRRHTHKPESI